MYLHIGNGKNIIKRNIVGIFDIDTATVSSVSRKFMKKMEKEKRTEYRDSDIPRSFILCIEEKKSTLLGRERRKNKWNERKGREKTLHLSRISSVALRARAMNESYNDYDVTEENN